MSVDVTDAEVRFGGVVALKEVGLTLDREEILAVVGPNGSGKSTLFNAITGLVPLHRGAVALDGEDMGRVPPHARVARGISRTFQTPRIDAATTVETSVLCGFYLHAKIDLARALLRGRRVAHRERELRERAGSILEGLGLGQYARRTIGELPMGLVRLVDIARAMAAEPRYLLLDEPAAGLTRPEQKMLASQIVRLARQGVGILLVEHNFALVRSVAERMIVLDRGEVLVRGKPSEVATDPKFVKAYLGSTAVH